MAEIDVAAAQAALAAQDEAEAPGVPRNPDGTFASQPAEPAAAPDEGAPAPAATPEAGTEEQVFTNIPDESLSPELLQMKRSLQADYTRKTQEIAPLRKLGQEYGISDAEEFRNAAETFQRLSDPRNWPVIHQELTDYMTQYGMSPAAASTAASEQLMQFAPDTPQQPPQVPQYSPDEDSGPDLTPLVQLLQQQDQRINQLTQMVSGDQQQRQQQAQFADVAGRLTQAENHIRAQNPHYDDSVIETIYNMMDANGDLLGAQQRYESIIGNHVAKYIAGKSAAATGASPPPSGGGVLSQEQPTAITAEEGHARAMALAAQLDREDATT